MRSKVKNDGLGRKFEHEDDRGDKENCEEDRTNKNGEVCQPTNFIQNIINEDFAPTYITGVCIPVSRRNPTVICIGHAKSICINFA